MDSKDFYRLTMQCRQIVGQQMLSDCHLGSRTDCGRHNVPSLLHIRSVSFVEPFQHWIPSLALEVVELIVFLEGKYI